MDLKVFKDTISSISSLCKSKVELPIEAEILVPDYLPQVFKIVKCFVYPVTLKKQAVAGKLLLEGYLRCVVYYQSDEDQSLCQTEQKIPFNRTMEIPACETDKIFVQVSGELEYVNCRAINQRRIDIRGAYGLIAEVFVQTQTEVITALADCGIEQKTQPMIGTKCVVNLDKLITAEEEIVLPQAPQAVLDISGTGQIEEVKIVSGKAVIKGKIQAHISYRTNPGCELESAEKSIPFNQIIDIDDTLDEIECAACAELIGCTMSSSGQEGSSVLTATIMLYIRAFTKMECLVVQDAFSTKYTTQISRKSNQCERLTEKLNKSVQADSFVTLPDENAVVLGGFCTLNRVEPETTGEGVVLSGRGTVHVLCKNSLGEIECYDKAFEYCLPQAYPGSAEEYRLECWQQASGLELQKADQEVKAKITICINGVLMKRHTVDTVDEVNCEELLCSDEPEVALRIYYANADENVFDIAKAYHVSPQMMMQLNHLEGFELNSAQQLLIPIMA